MAMKNNPISNTAIEKYKNEDTETTYVSLTENLNLNKLSLIRYWKVIWIYFPQFDFNCLPQAQPTEHHSKYVLGGAAEVWIEIGRVYRCITVSYRFELGIYSCPLTSIQGCEGKFQRKAPSTPETMRKNVI